MNSFKIEGRGIPKPVFEREAKWGSTVHGILGSGVERIGVIEPVFTVAVLDIVRGRGRSIVCLTVGQSVFDVPACESREGNQL